MSIPGRVGLPLPSKETTSYLILSLRAEYKQAAFFNDVLDGHHPHPPHRPDQRGL